MTKDFSYCLKGDIVVNVNHDQRRSGNKTGELQAYIAAVAEGMNDTELLELDPELCLKHSSVLLRAKLLDAEGRLARESIHVEVWYGGPGIGKSHRALQMYPAAFKYDGYDSGFWDGYTDQKVLILDEFSCGFCINDAKKVLDKQPYWLNIKFGGAWARWTTVIIITNEMELRANWYSGAKEHDREALFTRINVWNECRGVNRRAIPVRTSMDLEVPLEIPVKAMEISDGDGQVKKKIFTLIVRPEYQWVWTPEPGGLYGSTKRM
ncbi:hypothetical protein T492DRAFT_847765 [Pavlovales sp. CCMP2436]|nr:hypothetical protein T492DRAFT_847765 [Pavlovales sp. CCMP2436]